MATQQLTPAQVTVLRKITRDAEYRKTFFSNPASTLAKEGLSPSEAENIARITPLEIDGLQRAAHAVGGGVAADNCTLVYAVAFAIALALLLVKRDIITE